MSANVPDLQTIAPEDPAYPSALRTCLAFRTPPPLNAIGNLTLLQHPTIALFCSVKCPSDLILKTYDLVQSLQDAGIPTISGFHSPIEQDCLKILLRGTQPLIHCFARSLHKIRLSPEQKQAISDNRLLLISPFSASYPRATAGLAEKRNDLIGAIAHTILIAYAAPNSKTLAFAQRLIAARKSVITLSSPNNTTIQEQDIPALEIDAILKCYLSCQTITS